MQKTYNKSLYAKSRQNLTQTCFNKKRNYSRIKSHKNIEQGLSLKSEQSSLKISCSSWCLIDTKRNCLLGSRHQQQRQVASLTKIMTAILALQLMAKFQMEKDISIRVSHSAASLNGTTAELKKGRYIKLIDLLYGVMLPSGNDAAYLISEVFGLLLFYESVKPQEKCYAEIQSIDLTCYESTSTFSKKFITEMNRKSKELKLRKTNFSNPHGLANILNVSSAKDMAQLSNYCQKNKTFMEIVNHIDYRCNFYEDAEMNQVREKKVWKNTNKLLGEGWEGIKTGITSSAGSCLASIRNGIIIVVLNCNSKEARFKDTQVAYQWYTSNYF